MSPAKKVHKLVGIIGEIMDAMDVAEEELASGPEGTAFMDLQPSSLFRDKHKNLYRMHVRELIKRQGVGIDEPTHAEYAAVLSIMSLTTPLNKAAQWCYWRHFDFVFPNREPEPYANDYDRSELVPQLERFCKTSIMSKRRKKE